MKTINLNKFIKYNSITMHKLQTLTNGVNT